MNNKKIHVLILALMLFVTTLFVVGEVRAEDIASKKKETQAKINKLKWLEGVEKNKLYANQQKLEMTATTLKNSKEKYDSTKLELTDMETMLANSLAEYSALDFQMKKRIRIIFKTQRKGFFELLLSATDFNTFVDRIYFESIIINSDYRKMKKARAKAKEIALLKYNIEQKKRYLASSIKRINYQQKTIQKAINQNENMIHKLRTDRVAYEKAEKELAKQSASIGTMINRSAVATSSQSQVKVVSGFVKPISGSITSPFGWRTHPIFNSRSFHSGIDIGGPNGGVIRASNSGKVIYAGWYGGYGKVVIVDHGTVNGRPTTTLYAHMSTIRATQGQYVVKGQQIGNEGTTGYSTGPHCHFEVRVNGKPQNPLNYI